MAKIRIFLDTDVIISALLSTTGASFFLLDSSRLSKIISKTVKAEMIEVAARLGVPLEKPEAQKRLTGLQIVSLGLSKKQLLAKYGDCVFDEKDAHVVAGAHKVKAKFLLTHNLRHYQVDKIKADLGIVVMKPGLFLQYLRSLEG